MCKSRCARCNTKRSGRSLGRRRGEGVVARLETFGQRNNHWYGAGTYACTKGLGISYVACSATCTAFSIFKLSIVLRFRSLEARQESTKAAPTRGVALAKASFREAKTRLGVGESTVRGAKVQRESQQKTRSRICDQFAIAKKYVTATTRA